MRPRSGARSSAPPTSSRNEALLSLTGAPMCSSSTCSSSTFPAADGAGYDLQMGRWSRRLAPLLIDFAGLPESGRVLDVGCGTGSLTFALADRLRGGNVIGIDFSSDYIAHAARRCRDPRIRFEAGDAT